MKQGFFFDMDGVLFDSMPNHAAAWEEVMTSHGLPFSAKDCYINEGRTGQDVIQEAIRLYADRTPDEEEIRAIYKEKSDLFQAKGGALPMKDVDKVLQYLHARNAQIWIVTGSGQQSLFDHLDEVFPHIFSRERMITAYDVVHGKPDAEPYRKAWERSGLPLEACCVIENAPLGVRAGKAAGLFTIAVNTGPLDDTVLAAEGADLIFPDMTHLLHYLQTEE